MYSTCAHTCILKPRPSQPRVRHSYCKWQTLIWGGLGTRLPYACFKQLQGTCTQESFKALGCSYNCRRLTYGSLQLMHVTWSPRCSIGQVRASHGSQNENKYTIITALTKLLEIKTAVHDCPSTVHRPLHMQSRAQVYMYCAKMKCIALGKSALAIFFNHPIWLHTSLVHCTRLLPSCLSHTVE